MSMPDSKNLDLTISQTQDSGGLTIIEDPKYLNLTVS
jgi:hypothetical protein